MAVRTAAGAVGVSAAQWHEARLLWAARPAMCVLLRTARHAGPVRRLPRLGWLVSDPVAARRILNDHAHFTLLGEGGVGHLWAQVLGDYVHHLFDGPGHADLRARSRDLFTEENSAALTGRVFGPRVAAAVEHLRAGGVVDVADLARVLVGRMVAELLGLDPAACGAEPTSGTGTSGIGTTGTGTGTGTGAAPGAGHDAAYRAVFATGERLAALALGSAASTHLAPETVAEARDLVGELTRSVPGAFRTAPPSALLGRCRDLGLTLEETQGVATLLMVAGTETAATAMTRAVALLHDTGQQHRLLAAPGLLPGAVREALRVTTPAPVIGRHVSRDVTVVGRTLRAGERVLLLTWTANNAVGPFDLARPYVPETRQLWFGAGRHLCLGAPLARAEITHLLTALVKTGRPWRVVERRYARRVLIPSYATLRIALT